MSTQKFIDIANSLYIDADLPQTLDSTRQYAFNLDSLPQVLTYAGPGGAVDTITAGPDALGFSYKQTLSYTGSNVTSVSAWVKQ